MLIHPMRGVLGMVAVSLVRMSASFLAISGFSVMTFLDWAVSVLML